jgi:hypothetical protein
MMVRQSLFITIIIAALIGGGCATTAPYNPFKVTQEEIYAKTKTIALTPVVVPGDLTDPEALKAKFESLLEAKLREAGFLTVPSKEFAEIWKRMTEQVGGYFDPISGKRDESKLKTVREHTYRELSTKFNADACLHSNIRVFKINWSGTTARWHGASESIMPAGQQVLEVLVGINRYGTVPALSLTVSLQDTNEVNLYLNSGGIQLVSKLSGSKFVPVPIYQLLLNEERNLNAVNIALGPFIKKPGSAEEPK